MFLSELTREKQEAFLNLAYTMIYADGRLDAAEKKLFDTYKLEIRDADLSKAHKVDFAEGLAAFDDSSVKEKTGIFFELYATKMQEMRDGLNALTEAYANLIKIVEP